VLKDSLWKSASSVSTVSRGISLVMALTMVFLGARAGSESVPVVRTRQGQIEGVAVGKIEEFRGVPLRYAAARRSALASTSSTQALYQHVECK
jgi:hypothetical protein